MPKTNSNIPERSGIEHGTRARLEQLHREFDGPFTPADAASVLALSPHEARTLVAHLARRGWLSRVRRGLYTTVPLGADVPGEWREDPWLVANSLYNPCYLGGWTAASHWSLTEQIFRDVVVVTAASIRDRAVTIQGTRFRLRFLPEEKHFGTNKAWRDQTAVFVSDPSRTVVDTLDEPWMAGGIRHAAEIIAAYFESEHRDEAKVVEYADRLGNRTVFKRLGFLLETIGAGTPELVEQCRVRMSSGLSKLDPDVDALGRIRKRWNLRVNVMIEGEGPA